MITKAEIKRVQALADKAARYAEGLFVAEGEKLVAEVRASGFTLRAVYRVGRQEDAREVSAQEMGRLSLLKTPTPVLAVVEIPYYSKPFGSRRAYGFDRLAVALDGVQDPGNLGTIIRLADWFGVRDLFCSPDTADCWSPKVVQATMGAILRVRVHYRPLTEVLARAREQGVPIYGTFMAGESIYAATGLERDRGVIVLGNEGRGIGLEAAGWITERLSIPPYPPGARAGVGVSESLNVATAAGIVLSEFRRRG